MEIDPKERFSDRVGAYLRHRPGYPSELADLLSSECDLSPDAVVVDLGCGTGLLAGLFLRAGFAVIGVEPNRRMREAGEAALAPFDRFSSVSGSAEATTLPDDSADLVVAAQAFHWFDPRPTRREVTRILRPGGHLALVWNHRRKDSTPFLAGYESLLLEHGTDYRRVDHTRIGTAQLASFFDPAPMRSVSFETRQELDLEGLSGRLGSSSYVPGPDQPGHQAMLAAARELFAAHQSAGRVTLEYDTRVYWGPLSEGASGDAAPAAV